MKLCWPAPERNKTPILAVLREELPPSGTVLEIASGSGQHATYFAANLPGLVWQPSDIDDDNLASIRAHVDEAALGNLREPMRLDVREGDWRCTVDVIFNANMVHIAPFSAAEALFAGAGRHLTAQGVLVMYGPFKIGGAHTAESNEAFDRDLKARDDRWGVRDLEALEGLAASVGLGLVRRVEMPANNQTVVFRRRAAC